MSSCTTMRALVLLSAGLRRAGVLLLLVVETTGWLLPIVQLALPLVLGGPLLLGAALLIAFLPDHSQPCR